MKITTGDGWALHVDHKAHRGERKGAVVVLHAMMVDRRSMDRPRGQGLASFLADSGWEVFLADFRGHGESGPVAREGGQWTYDDLVCQDVPALVTRAARAGGPVYVVGLSLGGHVAAASAGAGLCAPDGLVLLSSNIWMPQLEPSRRRRRVKGLQMAVFRAISELRGRFPSRRLRMGPADECRTYVRDLHRFWRRDAWTARDGTDWLAGLATYEGRVLSVVGKRDRLMAHVDGARRWASPFPRLAFWHVGRGDHGLEIDPDHVGLGADPRCRPLWAAVDGWMSCDPEMVD